MIKEFTLENIDRKIRLDSHLSTILPDITRSTSKKVILKGLVKLNNKFVKPNTRVLNGDKLSVDLEGIRGLIDTNELTEITPVEMKLDIIFEDENSIILNKPSGIVVHPSYMHNLDTLMNGLVYYVIHSATNPFVRIRPVHRLDRDTSGVILFSKTLEAHNFYNRQFKNRDIEKTYLAVVKGDFQEYLNGREYIKVGNHIAKQPHQLVYSSSDPSKGDYAETDIYFEKHIGENNEYSLLRVIPHTGRTHQIRVHLSELGFPILGDVAYQGEEFKRLMLHAWKLRLKTLGTNEMKVFEAVVPEEFAF